MTDNAKLDILKAKDRTQQGREWRGTIEVPVDGEPLTYGYRLLMETEMTQLDSALPDEGGIDPEELDEELQEKYEELTDIQEIPESDRSEDEQERAEQLAEEIQSKAGDARDGFGAEAYEKILEAGVWAVKPNPSDVEAVWEKPPDEQERICGAIPNSKSDVEDALTGIAEDSIKNQPFPLKLRIGLKTLMTSREVFQGNALPSA